MLSVYSYQQETKVLSLVGNANTWAQANHLCSIVPQGQTAKVYDQTGTLRRANYASVGGIQCKQWGGGAKHSGVEERRVMVQIQRSLSASYKARMVRR